MTTSDQIIAVINDICAKFGIAIDWTQENIYPYLQQLFTKYINYELWTSVVWIVGTIITVFISYKLFRKAKANYDEDNYEDFNIAMYILSIVILVIMCLVTILVTIEQLNDIITCFTFPEKFLIDYINTMG